MFASLRLGILLPFLIVFSHTIGSTSSSLTLEELEKSKYEVELLKEPITSEQIAGDGVHLSNRHGQKFFCSIPEPDDNNDDQASQLDPPSVPPIKQSVIELLKPLQKLPCFKYRKGWWTYEVCPFGAIHQYHATPDEKIDGESIRLGMYDSEFDWSQIDPEQLRSLNLRYHVQRYVNGAKCDVNGKERRTDIKYICDEDEYISDVTELESCVYDIVFRTHRICDFPPLMPPKDDEPGWIICQPVLTSDQYKQYHDELELRSKQYANEERARLQDDGETLRKTFLGNDEGAESDMEIVDIEEISEEEFLKKSIRQMPWKRTVDKYAATIKETMSKQFEDIIQEAKEELGMARPADGGLGAEGQDVSTGEEAELLDEEAMSTLKATLNDLLTKLDQMEEEMGTTDDLIDDIDRRLEKLKLARKAKGQHQNEGEPDEDDEHFLLLQELEREGADYLIDDLDLNDELILEEGDEIGNAGGAGRLAGGGGTGLAGGGNQQMRRLGEHENGELQDRPTPSAEVLNGEGVLLKRLPNLEHAIQRRLEQMGLSELAGSKGLKIKIVTTDTKTEGGEEIEIDEEQTKKLEGMVLAYLNHNSELFQHESRQQKLKDSYNFVYSKKTKDEDDNGDSGRS